MRSLSCSSCLLRMKEFGVVLNLPVWLHGMDCISKKPDPRMPSTVGFRLGNLVAPVRLRLSTCVELRYVDWSVVIVACA